MLSLKEIRTWLDGDGYIYTDVFDRNKCKALILYPVLIHMEGKLNDVKKVFKLLMENKF